MVKKTFFNALTSVNCRGKLLDLTIPRVMGIVNLTPDSFYDGKKHKSENIVLKNVEKMLTQDASIIDVGGYSSRPGAQHISADEEIKRVIPAIKSITKKFPDTIVSIDTFRSSVAKEALESGASMVNDISAGEVDEKMIIFIAQEHIPYIAMHMQGTPQTMQQKPFYKDIMGEISSYFSNKLSEFKKQGITDVIVDPGFGFGKRIEHNYELLGNMEKLKILKRPILAGISRKSMIYKQIQSNPEGALNGTTALNMVALMKGANILRVHDVKEAKETIDLFLALKKNE